MNSIQTISLSSLVVLVQLLGFYYDWSILHSKDRMALHDGFYSNVVSFEQKHIFFISVNFRDGRHRQFLFSIRRPPPNFQETFCMLGINSVQHFLFKPTKILMTNFQSSSNIFSNHFIYVIWSGLLLFRFPDWLFPSV